ncbi:MAG: hypothetical protein LIO77_02545 [Rikenellaceae bacterium]|nr:hypothetical protein [Rikenellaceae bacterium]
MKKLLLVGVSLFLLDSVQSQHLSDLRRMILQSDVIIAGKTSHNMVLYNDYTKLLSFTVGKLDKVIDDAAGFQVGDTVKVLQPFRDLSVFWNQEKVYIENVEEFVEEPYTDLHFIRRDDALNFVSVGSIYSVEWHKYKNHYLPAIEKFLPITRIGDPEDRYAKTIDWYIECNGYPDDDFFAFYKEMGIITDSIYLSESQSARAREKFMHGSEKLLPFIREDFPADVYSYYLKKMREIRNKRNPEWRDWYDFTRCIENIWSPPYYSMDYYLKRQLTQDYTSEYDRNRIMDHFISKIETSIEETGSK